MSAKTWTIRDEDGDPTIVHACSDRVRTYAGIEDMSHTPASARELAAALIEAADIVEGVKRDVEQVPDLTDPQTVHWLFDMLAQAHPGPKPEAPPVPDYVHEAIKRLCNAVECVAREVGQHGTGDAMQDVMRMVMRGER